MNATDITYERVRGFIPAEFETKGFDLYVPFATNDDVMFGIMRDYDVRALVVADTNPNVIQRLKAMSDNGSELLRDLESLAQQYRDAADKKAFLETTRAFLTKDEKPSEAHEVAAKMLLAHDVAGGIQMPFYDFDQMSERIQLLGDVCPRFLNAGFEDVQPSVPGDSLFFIQRPADMTIDDKIRLTEYKIRIERCGAKIIHYY
jgi:predicted transcriptional regulator